MRSEAPNRRLIYLGAIDDKVVEYKNIPDPEERLKQILFFSAILGDPLVLNDGYLLHRPGGDEQGYAQGETPWGLKQIIEPASPLRQLIDADHLFVASRSARKYSDWVAEQANLDEKTTDSYRKVHEDLLRDPEQTAKLDDAYAAISPIALTWPKVDLQDGLASLLTEDALDLLRSAGVHASQVNRLFILYDGFRAKETVRSAWEMAVKALTASENLSPLGREELNQLFMEVANEAYHANFAVGLSTMNGGAGVGVSGYGRQRLAALRAYREETAHSDRVGFWLSEAARNRIEKAATVRLPKNFRDICGRHNLADFIQKCGVEKKLYRDELQSFLRSEEPEKQRVRAFEEALRSYAETIEKAFEPGSEKGWIKTASWVQTSTAAASLLLESVGYLNLLPRDHDHALQGIGIAVHAVPVAFNQVRGVVKTLTTQKLSILPQADGLYELDLGSEFTARHLARLKPYGAPSSAVAAEPGAKVASAN